MITQFAGIKIEFGRVYGKGEVLNKVNEMLSKKPKNTRCHYCKASEVAFFAEHLVILDNQFDYSEMIVLTYIELNE